MTLFVIVAIILIGVVGWVLFKAFGSTAIVALIFKTKPAEYHTKWWLAALIILGVIYVYLEST